MNNILRYLGGEQTTAIIDLLLDQLKDPCMGKNDLALANALLAVAATVIATHCQTTGHDHDEMAGEFRSLFDMALNIAADKIPESAAP